MRILVTGGCGFIGSHLIKSLLDRDDLEKIVNIDSLTYAGQPMNLSEVENDSKYHFVHGPIEDSGLVNSLFSDFGIDIVVNLAAESHVDRSINSVSKFVTTNIDGTRVLLEEVTNRSREGENISFIQISTDEVYGSLGPEDAPFTEETPLNPMNPYSVTKASADMMVRAFVNTHSISAAITRCSNNYGPNQFPEKLIPLMILNCQEGKDLPVYGDGLQIRDWIHVSDHVSGIISVIEGLLMDKISSGEVINFGADKEIANIEIVKSISKIVNPERGRNLIKFVPDRPGHDRRYAMGYSKAERVLEWSPVIKWEEGLSDTIDWYKQNWRWVDSVRSGEYREWIKNQYNQ